MSQAGKLVDSSSSAVSGPGTSTVGDIATWANTGGTQLADSGVAFSTDGTLAANSDSLVSTQKAVKTYVDARTFATPVSLANGGTSKALVADNGGIVYSDADSMEILAHTNTANQVLLSGNASSPTWSTATYPSVGTSTGSFLRANGTNWVASTTTIPDTVAINGMYYASSANVLTVLAPVVNRVLCTSSGGIPNWANSLPFLTVSTSSLSSANITCTDGSAAAALFNLNRSGGSPANSDITFALVFNGQDSGVVTQEFGRIQNKIINVTAGAEDGSLEFYTQSNAVSTLQMNLLNTGGQYRGNNTNTAAPAGYIGEIIESKIASGSAVSLTTATPANLTSISLTPGNWVIDGVVCFNGTLTGTQSSMSIGATSATLGTAGDNLITSPTVPLAGSDYCMTLPGIKVSLSATTTYYLVAQTTFTVGTAAGYGRITAVRIG